MVGHLAHAGLDGQLACTVLPNSWRMCVEKSNSKSERKNIQVFRDIWISQAYKLTEQEWGDMHHPHISTSHPYILKLCAHLTIISTFGTLLRMECQ